MAFVLDLTKIQKTESDLAKSLAEVRDLTGRLLTAQENERRLIARNLHDGLVQELVAHKVSLSILAREPEMESAGLRKDILRLERDAQQLAEHARKISHDIHPAALEHLGLMAALRSNATEVRRMTDVEVLIETEGKLPALTREASLGLFRIAQEAVWNAARHSGANTVMVTVRADSGSVELTVTDHGRGFDFSKTFPADSLGLVSMKERARLIRASLDVDSTPGAGTTVQAVMRREAAK